jgi:hypothetical protein
MYEEMTRFTDGVREIQERGGRVNQAPCSRWKAFREITAVGISGNIDLEHAASIEDPKPAGLSLIHNSQALLKTPE